MFSARVVSKYMESEAEPVPGQVFLAVKLYSVISKNASQPRKNILVLVLWDEDQ